MTQPTQTRDASGRNPRGRTDPRRIYDRGSAPRRPKTGAPPANRCIARTREHQSGCQKTSTHVKPRRVAPNPPRPPPREAWREQPPGLKATPYRVAFGQP
jgi:hypothetical protein